MFGYSITNLHTAVSISKTFSYFQIDLSGSCTLNEYELHLQNILNNDKDDNQTTVTVTVINDPRLPFFVFYCFGTTLHTYYINGKLISALEKLQMQSFIHSKVWHISKS